MRRRIRGRGATDATRLRDGLEVIHLGFRIELPEIRLQRVVHHLPAEMDFGHAVMTVPFRFRHEAEQQVQHFLVFDIEEMPAADVERRAIHRLAPAQSSSRGFFFQNQDFGKRHAAIQ